MRAVAIQRFGGPEVLKLIDLPKPSLKTGEVRVKVKACALNHLDIWVRNGIRGLRLDFPHILGADVSGVIEELGSGVSDLTPGISVFIAPGISCGHCYYCSIGDDNLCSDYGILGEHRAGGYGEYIVVPRVNIFPIPNGLSFIDAAAFPLTFLTAWNMVVRKACIEQGQTVLILAAGSGVGSAALQIAAMMGAQIIATASSADKLEKTRQLGANFLINHSEAGWLEKIKDLTQGQGVDVVIEQIGENTWQDSLRAVRRGGKIVTCGATSGHRGLTDIRHVYYRQIAILGSTMGRRGDLFRIIQAIEAGKIFPIIDSIFPLDEVGEAQRKMESRNFFGKIVLKVD